MSKKNKNRTNRYFTNKKEQWTVKKPKYEELENPLVALDLTTINSTCNKSLITNYIIEVSYDDAITNENLLAVFRIMRDFANFFGDKSIATLLEYEIEDYLATYINDGYGSIVHNLAAATICMFYESLNRNGIPAPKCDLNKLLINYDIRHRIKPTFVFEDVLRQHNK